MHKIEIPERHIMKEFPSEIQEMDQDQFVHFISLILEFLSGKITIDRFKASLIIKLLDVKLDFMYAFLSREERENAYAEIFLLGELCESFFEQTQQDGKMVKTFKLSFTRNFIPSLCGKYYGPKDAIQDLTFCEYRTAHSHYTSYLESHNDNDLNLMIAVLYRPAKRFLWLKKLLPSFNGQIRMPFTAKSNPLFLESRVQAIAKLPLAIRYGIFLYFSGCEQFLAKGTLNIDGKPIDLSIIYERGDEPGDSPDIGLIGILYSLAETKVFGSIEETDSQNLYDIMVRLYQVVKQSKVLEEKFNSHGSD